MRWKALAALPATLVLTPQAVMARPVADKLIVLVHSQGCDWAHLSPRLHQVGRALADDQRTSRVSLDLPEDPVRNLDLMGRPSPWLGAVEASAGGRHLRALAHLARRGLGGACMLATYRVRERRLLTSPRTWPLGLSSPASKALVTLVRKPGVSTRTFAREWTGPHADMSLAWRARRGGPGHYVQNLVVGRIGRETPALDGIGEAEGPGAAPGQQEREARMKTAAHAATFQDTAHSAMLVAREVILKDRPVEDAR